MPSFVVLVSGTAAPDGGASLWGSGFLPTIHQGVQMRSSGDPVLFLSNPEGMAPADRRRSLDTLKALNELQLQAVGDPEILTRIDQYEMAYRMQTSVPEMMDISQGDEADARDVRRQARRKKRSPTIACWPGGWSRAASASCSCTTGAGTTMATRQTNDIAHRAWSTAARRRIGPWRRWSAT